MGFYTNNEYFYLPLPLGEHTPFSCCHERPCLIWIAQGNLTFFRLPLRFNLNLLSYLKIHKLGRMELAMPLTQVRQRLFN